MLLPRLRIRKAASKEIKTRFRNAGHTYYDVQPWSQDGRRLVYGALDSPDDACSVVVQDLETGQETVLAQTQEFHWHSFASQRWAFRDEAVCFLHSAEGAPPAPALASASGGEPHRRLDKLQGRRIRQILSDGTRATAFSQPRDGEGPYCIELVNLETQARETLVTADQALAALPKSLYKEGCEHFLNHPVFNADESRMFFKLMRWLPEGMPEFCAFFVLDAEAGEVRCFGDEVSGHPYWMPDGRHIVNIRNPHDDSGNRWLVLVDSDTGKDEPLVDLFFPGPGHPSVSPDGRWVITDGFSKDGQWSRIYVLDLETGAGREVMTLGHRFQGGKGYNNRITRGQPHPVWSPDGRSALINFNYGGERMGMLALTGFLA